MIQSNLPQKIFPCLDLLKLYVFQSVLMIYVYVFAQFPTQTITIDFTRINVTFKFSLCASCMLSSDIG